MNSAAAERAGGERAERKFVEIALDVAMEDRNYIARRRRCVDDVGDGAVSPGRGHLEVEEFNESGAELDGVDGDDEGGDVREVGDAVSPGSDWDLESAEVEVVVVEQSAAVVGDEEEGGLVGVVPPEAFGDLLDLPVDAL